MLKVGYTDGQVVSGEDYSCQFHKPLRDDAGKRVEDRVLISVSYGKDSHDTQNMIICTECWESFKKFVNSIESDIMPDCEHDLAGCY